MTRGVFDKSTRVRSRKLPREARTGVCVLRVPLASSQAVQCKLRRNPPGWPILDEFFARGKCDLPNLHNNDVPGKCTSTPKKKRELPPEKSSSNHEAQNTERGSGRGGKRKNGEGVGEEEEESGWGEEGKGASTKVLEAQEAQDQNQRGATQADGDCRGAFYTKSFFSLAKRGTHHFISWSHPSHLLLPPPPPNQPTQERQERKRRAKDERKSKGENLLKEGGERKCKICAKVRLHLHTHAHTPDAVVRFMFVCLVSPAAAPPPSPPPTLVFPDGIIDAASLFPLRAHPPSSFIHPASANQNDRRFPWMASRRLSCARRNPRVTSAAARARRRGVRTT